MVELVRSSIVRAARWLLRDAAMTSFPRRLGRFLIRPAFLAVLSMLLAFAAALITYAHFDFSVTLLCSGETVRGSNMYGGLALVSLSTPAELLLIFLTRKRRRLLTAILLLGAAMLAIAITLVAIDSATYIVRTCGSAHASYLYFLWGAPLALLLLQAARAWRPSNAGRFSLRSLNRNSSPTIS
jgi:hypothetical protein